MSGLSLGDRSRCLRCDGKIVLVKDPRVISLRSAVWVHSSSVRRFAATHAAEGPTR